MRTKKAQIQIMENIFVIFIIIFILIIAFVFVISVKNKERIEKADEMREVELMKKSQVLSFLPEMQCSDNNEVDPDCYDLLKIEAFTKKINEDMVAKSYYRDFLGNIYIRIKSYEISPDFSGMTGEWEVYDNPKPKDLGVREIRYPVLIKDVNKETTSFGVIFLGVYR